jgi:cytochrome c oxidase assembly factor CtaG
VSRPASALGLCGGLAAAVAVSPPVDAAATRSLSSSMLQHLLLTMVAAPLLALAIRGGGRLDTGRGRAAAAASWAAFVGAIWIVHLSRAADLAVTDTPLRYAIHALFLGTAAAFWHVALGGSREDRGPVWRIAYLFTAMTAMDVVGVWLMSSAGLEYPAYGRGPGALSSQHLAGALMLAGSYPIALAGLVEAWRFIVHEHEAPAGEEQVA